jgi:hypothetical protein
MTRAKPSFWVVLVMSLVPLATIGAFAGVQVRDDPDAVVATTLFIVAAIDVLGLVRYVADGKDHRERSRVQSVYQSRLTSDNADEADKRRAKHRLLDLETSDPAFDGAWMLLPQLGVSVFAVAMAVSALVGG